MSDQNRNGRFLPLLRELQAKGATAELFKLIKHLKKTGYPKSILRAFELRCSQDSPIHPYRYESEDAVRHLGQIVSSPLVSVILVVYNSADHLGSLLKTLQHQSYTNYELIVVNNGEEDLSDLLLSWDGRIQLIKAPNPGFAEANNIGLEKATGDVLLLLNPDTELQTETIKELVHALEVDSTAAAAIPLIYFSRPFYKLSVKNIGEGRFALNIDSMLAGLQYKKFFVRDGERRDDGLIYCNASQHISLDIALNVESDCFAFEVLSIGSLEQQPCLQIAFEGSGEKACLISIDQPKTIVRLALTKRVHSSSRYLINNAGSAIRPGTLTPYDLGFAEVNHGQFATRAYREALCGCCALLRRDLFIKRKIFISEFFAYYEDSELSFWLRRNQMNILFVPSAIVFHRHSEATGEHSFLWKQLISRSEKIYAWVRDSSLHHCSHRDAPFALETVQCPTNQKLVETLNHYDQHLIVKPIEELITRTRRFTVGIYNSYWSSAGGGERHALDLAMIANKADCEVYLISEAHFSLEELRNFYGNRLDGVKTLVTGEVTESLTQRFDIFINSTFCSSLISRAEISYYITSFPHRNVTPSFISSYVFLHNSPYTHRWALRFWGAHQHRLLLPVLSFSAQIAQESSPSKAEELAGCKEKLILSVGRFNYDGHCKNQHIIAKTFSALSQSGEISPHWQLVIAGSVDWHVHASVSHLNATKKILEGSQARVIPNAASEDLDQLYRSASIFLNAAGLGSDPVHAPERSEHFGIAAFEALLSGCRLVSYTHGGPAIMVENSKGGFTYGQHDELANALLQAISACELEDDQERVNRICDNTNYCQKKIGESLFLAHSLFSSSYARL